MVYSSYLRWMAIGFAAIAFVPIVYAYYRKA